MNSRFVYAIGLTAILLLFSAVAGADVNVQCPGDNDGDARWNTAGETQPLNTECSVSVRWKHSVAGITRAPAITVRCCMRSKSSGGTCAPNTSTEPSKKLIIIHSLAM